MRAHRWVLGVSGALVLAAVIGCDGSLPSNNTGTGGQGAGVPAFHRATAAACSAQGTDGAVTTPATDGGSPGQVAPDAAVNVPCLTASDCGPCPTGVVRCLVRSPAQPNACVCDQCNSDQDCPSTEACLCFQTTWARYPAGNTCVQGNCRVDSDCGAGGYCSPTVSGCGYGAYYCHTPADTCLNDTDCAGSSIGCVYSPTTGAWGCASIVCIG
jgi:hypothetical protein